MAFTVHLEHKGMPINLILDIVEVPQSHTGAALAKEFHKILESFGISDKVRSIPSHVNIYLPSSRLMM